MATSKYIGDFVANSVVRCSFGTVDATNQASTCSSVVAVCYKSGSTTEDSTTVVVTADYDSRTGYNHVVCDCSLNSSFFVAGFDYRIVITSFVVSTVTYTNREIAQFSIENRNQHADIIKLLGTALVTPATAGILEVNIKNINNVSASTITTVGVYIGTTQPINFTGTAGAALVQVDLIDWKSAAVGTPATAGVPDINVKNYNNQVAATGTDTFPKVSVWGWLGSTFTEGATGRFITGMKAFFNVAAPTSTMNEITLVDTITTYTGNTPQTGDAYALLNARLTAARAGYLDNLNVGGAVASHADVLAINTSSSKHIILMTVGQYERPESGSTLYTVEARTYSAIDGSAVNADTTPTLTSTGQTSGNLSGNLSAATNPATGVYRWTYTVASGATQEPIRHDLSAVIAASTYTMSVYTQVVDEVSATWTSTDATHLTTLFNAIPAGGFADQINLAAAVATVSTQTTAASIRADVGLGSANLDSQLATIEGHAATADTQSTAAATSAATAATQSTAGAASAATAATQSTAANSAVSGLATKFSGITLVKNWLGMLGGSGVDNTTKAEINATAAGATYNNATQSLQVIAANEGGGGGGGSGTNNPIRPE